VKVHTFKTQELPLTRAYSWKDDQGVEHQGTRFTSRTQVDLSVTVQAVDCKTGKVYSAQRLVANQAREAVSVHGEPAFPSRAEVQDLAFADVTRDLRRMLLGWEEVRSLIFYDDKDYGMKEAYQKLKAGDYRSALVKSLEARDKAFGDARARPKHRSRTSYNLGMCSFILGDYDAALPCLRAACEVEPANGIFNESLKECLKALRLREEMAKVDSRSSAAKVEAVAPDPAGKSLEDRLQVLERLKEKGLLTPEEYRRRKDELLKEI